MSMQDPVSDMLTRIRNAQMARHVDVRLPSSKIKVAIAKVLYEEGYITSFQVDTTEAQKPVLHIELKFYQHQPVIASLKRISRPGLRIFRSHQELPKVKGGLGVAIISTPKGVMTDGAARAQGVGGEVLCEVM